MGVPVQLLRALIHGRTPPLSNAFYTTNNLAWLSRAAWEPACARPAGIAGLRAALKFSVNCLWSLGLGGRRKSPAAAKARQQFEIQAAGFRQSAVPAAAGWHTLRYGGAILREVRANRRGCRNRSRRRQGTLSPRYRGCVRSPRCPGGSRSPSNKRKWMPDLHKSRNWRAASSG